MDDEGLQLLIDLGLGFLQSKIYLALSQTGKATVGTISKTAHVARQDVYQILPKLEKLGLVEKIIAVPTMYKAIPLKKGYNFLLEKKTGEYNALKMKTIEILKKAHENNNTPETREETNEFFLISSYKLQDKRVVFENSLAQKSLDIIHNFGVMNFRIFYDFKIYERLLKRGMKVRIISENHNGAESLRNIPPPLRNNPLFEIRYLDTAIRINVAIYDKKRATLIISSPQDNEIAPSLWSANPQFVEVILTYFEYLWKKSHYNPKTRQNHKKFEPNFTTT